MLKLQKMHCMEVLLVLLLLSAENLGFFWKWEWAFGVKMRISKDASEM